MSDGRITLFAEDLRQLASALPADIRLPALERLVARADASRHLTRSPNHLRFELLGLEAPPEVPVAALSRAAEGNGRLPDGSHWLRMDPVSMRADMTRVFLVDAGYSDYDAEERKEVEEIVRAACAHRGHELAAIDSNGWCLRLETPTGFRFTPLGEALGMDMAEALPDHPDAAPWKRLLTEIQVDLHQAEVSMRRREQGRPVVNSVWFWGAGPVPPVERLERTVVVTDDPVSRGLGVLAGCPVLTLASIEEAARPPATHLLIDWVMPSRDAAREAKRLETLVSRLLADGKRPVELVDGEGCSWRYSARSRWRAGRRARPLPAAIGGERS